MLLTAHDTINEIEGQKIIYFSVDKHITEEELTDYFFLDDGDIKLHKEGKDLQLFIVGDRYVLHEKQDVGTVEELNELVNFMNTHREKLISVHINRKLDMYVDREIDIRGMDIHHYE